MWCLLFFNLQLGILNFSFCHHYIRRVSRTGIPSTDYIYTKGVTSGAETAYSSGAPEFTLGFCEVRVTRSLVLCVYCVDRRLFFCPFSFGQGIKGGNYSTWLFLASILFYAL
jgi:hypothetical protein